MLKDIKNVMKIMGEAMSFSNVGEMLTQKQKSEVMIGQKKSPPIAADQPQTQTRVLLVGDEEFSSNAVERAIALCRKRNTMLELLCISSENSDANEQLPHVVSLLETANDLEYQITRRYGNLRVETDAYLNSRHDDLVVIVNASDHLRNQMGKPPFKRKCFRTQRLSTVELSDDVIHI